MHTVSTTAALFTLSLTSACSTTGEAPFDRHLVVEAAGPARNLGISQYQITLGPRDAFEVQAVRDDGDAYGAIFVDSFAGSIDLDLDAFPDHAYSILVHDDLITMTVDGVPSGSGDPANANGATNAIELMSFLSRDPALCTAVADGGVCRSPLGGFASAQACGALKTWGACTWCVISNGDENSGSCKTCNGCGGW